MKNKATLVFSLLLVAMLSLFFSITIYMEKQLYSWMEQRFSAELLESANFIDGVLLTLNLEMTVNQLDPFIDSISQKSIERITIIDSMGKVIADSDLNVSQILTVENHKSRPEIISATNMSLELRYALAKHLKSLSCI